MLLVRLQNGATTWENSGAVFYRVNTPLTIHPAIPLLSIYPSETKTYTHTETLTHMFIERNTGSNPNVHP